jgi:molecular chaperone Hsp33
MTHAAPDHVVRAITLDGAFRVIATIPTGTANGASAAQRLRGAAAAQLAELITCAVLIRETTQPVRRVQLVWRDRSGATVVADSLPDGTSRGIVNPGSSGDGVEPADEHLMQVNYTLPNGALHQGVIAVDPGTDLATALMQYMQTSEQIVAMVALGVVLRDGGGAPDTGVASAVAAPDRGASAAQSVGAPPSDQLDRAAAGALVDVVAQVGGYVVQVLPEVTREGLEAMSRHLTALPAVHTLVAAAGGNPRLLIDRVLEGFPFAELADTPVMFGCTCSEARVITGILSLPADEVLSMEAGPSLEVRCDACGTTYDIDPSSLRAMRELRERGEAPS